MAKTAKRTRPTLDDISIAEVNLALEKLLKDKIKTKRLLSGKSKSVPVFFRGRDSKIIPDTTSGGLIEVSYDTTVRAEGGYQIQCEIFHPISCDENGEPLEYLQMEHPEAIWLMYTISARSDNWNDIIRMQSKLDRIFPVNHGTIHVKGSNMHLFREGLNSADDNDLGLFIREYSIKILGYIYGDCDENKIVPAIKRADLEVSTDSDPNSEVGDTFLIFDC